MRENNICRQEKRLHGETILRCAIIFLILSGAVIAVLSQALALAPVFREYLKICLPSIMNCPFVSMPVYLTMCWIFSLIVATLVLIKIRRFASKKIIIRNKDYINELLRSKYNGEPAADRSDLAKKIYGESEKYDRVPVSVQRMIDWNIKNIKTFLDDDIDDNILVINSKWGSGKTTNLLIAINESSRENRYIYESAFKYNVENNELCNDLLKALEDVILELGIKIKSQISAIISNLSSDYEKTIVSYLTNDVRYNLLSTDAIYEINYAYRNSNKDTKVFIIIDDLDRLKGDDIAKIISLLSILRRIDFVRIIIPADLDIINESLGKANYANPSKFTEKYLPSKRSLRLKSNYEIAQKVALEKLSRNKRSDMMAALSAVYFSLLSKEMERQTTGYSNYRHYWLSKADNEAEQNIDLVNEQIRQLLSIPRIIHNKNKGLNRLYQWDAKYNNIRQVENIVYALQAAPMTISREAEALRGNMSTQEYEYAVKSWIFEYIEQRWDIFGFSLRDLLDIIKTIKLDKMPKSELKQFEYVYNQLFPNKKIKIRK